MKVMDANAVAYELCDKNCIDRGAMNRITKTTCDPAEQNQILHLALKDKCTDEAFLVACDIIIAVKGNPKMKALGENMKMLTGKGTVCVCARVCACACACVCVCVCVCVYMCVL